MARDLAVETFTDNRSPAGRAELGLTLIAAFALGALMDATVTHMLESDYPVALGGLVLILESLLIGFVYWRWKRRSLATGVLLSALFGPLALLLLLVPRAGAPKPGEARAVRECPSCLEPMRREAKRCPHCTEPSPRWDFNPVNRWWQMTDLTGQTRRYDERRGQWLLIGNGTPAPAAPADVREPVAVAASRVVTLGDAEGFYPDPTGRHQERYWTGTDWTGRVRDRGSETFDSLGR
jgi:hypothetical protein